MKKYLILSVVTVCLVCIFSSCNTGDKSGKNLNDSTEIDNDLTKMIYPIPTPFEISQMLQKSGAAYILDLTNPIENAEKYFTEKSKALNLGVYGADLSYTSTYNKAQDTRGFLGASKKLTDDLGISSMVKQSLLERAESNLENKDSLYKIVSESYYDNFNYLNNNGKGAIAVMVLAGGWIEGLYLSTQIATLTKDNAKIMENIGGQKITGNSLVGLLEMHKSNQDVSAVIEMVQKINNTYTDVKQNENDVFVLSKEQFEKITKTVTEIRTEITKVN